MVLIVRLQTVINYNFFSFTVIAMKNTMNSRVPLVIKHMTSQEFAIFFFQKKKKEKIFNNRKFIVASWTDQLNRSVRVNGDFVGGVGWGSVRLQYQTDQHNYK